MIDKKFLHSIPKNPGVYIMRDSENEIIYVGKAKNLKNRVNQYFTKNSNHTEKVRAMVSRVSNLEYIITNSETEALNLECSLIKENRPKYNILLKDDKGYPYIKITNEEFPRIVLARRQEKDGAKYFGPFVSTSSVKQILDSFNKLFRLRQCNTLVKRDKPCLNYHIKICEAPCIDCISKEEYTEKISALTDILNGNANKFISELKDKMETASENLDFENAAQYRDMIVALNKILERQLVVTTGNENEDVVYLYKENDRICIQMLYMRNGKLLDKKAFFMNNAKNENDGEVMRAFLLQYYSEFDIPKKIYISYDVPDVEEVETYLEILKGSKVYIASPQRGDKVRFLEMAKKNAAEAMRLKYRKADNTKEKREAVAQLAHYLELDDAPVRIEAYDISHTSGTEVVASMVVFVNGVPSKQNYRKFKMKESLKNDDYAAMGEVLKRRFKYLKESAEESKFSVKPDLILVDGGIGQVNAAVKVAEKEGVSDISIFGVFKDDKHRTCGVVDQQKEYQIPIGTKCFSLVTEIQNEMHRVAINYHRLLRSRKNTESELLKIPGVGKSRFKALLSTFKTVSALKKATVEEISKIRGISKEQAEIIYNYLKQE